MQVNLNTISITRNKSVMLVGDQILYREALAELLTKHHFEIIAQIGFNEQMLGLTDYLRPDVIIADPCNSSENSIPLITQLKHMYEDSKIALISLPCSNNLYMDFIQAGASAIILKTQPPSVLLKAIDKILLNESWLDKSAHTTDHQETRELDSLDQATEIEDHFLSCLSKREREIVGLVVKGLNTISIAQTLHISEKTVRNHIYSIYGKLEVKDRLELALLASQNGLSRIAKFEPREER